MRVLTVKSAFIRAEKWNTGLGLIQTLSEILSFCGLIVEEIGYQILLSEVSCTKVMFVESGCPRALESATSLVDIAHNCFTK